MRSLQLKSSLGWLLLAAILPTHAAEPGGDPAVVHESLLTLDTHLDTPSRLSWREWSIFDRHDVADDGSQVDLPRMIEGGLDGGFFAIYTPQGPLTAEGDAAARDAALLRALSIRELVAAHPDRFELALKADDAEAIAARGRRIVYLSIENGAPFEGDLSLLGTFYKLGVRVVGPVHFRNNRLGDSSTDPAGPKWAGLSDLGKQFVAEANRLGIVIDMSHASDEALDQAIRLSKTPILLSHSGAKAVFDHPRSIDDGRLRALAKSGGVIQIYAYSDYMLPAVDDPQRRDALAELQRENRRAAVLSAAERRVLAGKRQEIDRRFPVARATFEDFIAHLLHAIQVAGVDHVGIGLDFDGGGGVAGLEDAADYPRITARLLEEGFTREDLGKIWSGNVLRVLRAAEAAARIPE